MTKSKNPLNAALAAIDGFELDVKMPTMREFSSNLLLPAGPLKGLSYDPTSDPCQEYIINQMDLEKWERLYVCAPPQVGGKTQVCILTPALRFAIAGQLPVGYALPTLDALDKAWAEKIKPSIVGAGFADYLPSKGPGARGGRAATLTFVDPVSESSLGRLVFLAGGAYGSTVAAVLLDEIDQFRAADGSPDYSAIEDIFARADSYGAKAIRIGCGTIEDDQECIITTMIDTMATGTRPWLMCPHCREHQRVSQKQIEYDDTSEDSAAETARIVCKHCGKKWNEDQRQDAVRELKMVHRGQAIEGGEVVGPQPQTRSLGLLWSAWDSSLSSLQVLARKHWAATQSLNMGQHGPMRKYARYSECRTYLDDVLEDDQTPSTPTREFLVRKGQQCDLPPYHGWRSERDDIGANVADSYHCVNEQVPDLSAISLGVDVQRGGNRAPGRLYFYALGARGAQRVPLAWGHQVVSPIGRWPSKEELVKGLDSLDLYLGELLEEQGAPIVAKMLDTGDQTRDLQDWLRSHQSWTGIKGDNNALKPTLKYTINGRQIIKPKSKRDTDGVLYWRFNPETRVWTAHIPTDKIRADIHRRLLLPVDEKGSWLVPPGSTTRDTLITHMCGTAQIVDKKGKIKWSSEAKDRRDHPEWQARIDLLDCAIYAEAGLVARLTPKKTVRAAKNYGKLN